MAKVPTRRTFLKISAGAAALTATGMSAKARRIIMEPFVKPPEETLPGRATWFASTCRQCSAGCGIIVRTVNGRAKKVEGNPLHPLNQGKLCARGQAGLQVLYNPDRIQNALQSSAERGSGMFEPIYWPEAIDLLAEKIGGLSRPDRMAFLTGHSSDHQYFLAARLLEAIGAPAPIVFDMHSVLEGRSMAHQASEIFFGSKELPVYDLGRTEVVLSFGANFLETWMSPVAQSHAYGAMRSGQFGGRGLVIHLEPRLSTTAASADEWIPLGPGMEGLVALGIGRIIVEENLGHVGSRRPFAMMYEDVDIHEVATLTEVPVETLTRLAQVFMDANQAVAIPGGYLSGQSNGLQSALAIQALNLLAAQLGRVGGVYLSQPGPTGKLRGASTPDSFNTMRDLITRMSDGDIELLLIADTNPLFELPDTVGFADALAQVPYVVSFSPFFDETSLMADLILPGHTYLEAWGYQVVSPGGDRPIVSGQQPVVQPLYDTRPTGDVLLALARGMGEEVQTTLPWSDEAAFMEDVAADLQGSSLSIYDAASIEGFWALWRQHGGWWSEKEIRIEPEVTAVSERRLSYSPPLFQGDVVEYPLHLYPYSSITLTDGRGSNLPWLQEAPDPMTTARWSTWVEINPETAQGLGVTDNDLVRVISPFGQIEAAVVVYPGIRPDVVAIPVGQGHENYGRFARERGSNPMKLLAPATDPDSGSLAWGTTRVRIERINRRYELARLENLDGEGRESPG